MEDNKQLKPRGVVEPKGVAWLKEVRIDAARNTVEQLRQQAERKEFEEAKARGLTPQEVIEKGREDLKKTDPTFGEVNDGGFDYDPPAKNKEAENLRKQLQAERTARVEAENKLKAQSKPEDKKEAK